MKTVTMNQMNLMNLFQGLRCIKKKNSFLSLGLGAEKVHPGTSVRFCSIFGGFLSIHSYKSFIWMNQMYMDEPLANFKRAIEVPVTSLPIEMNLCFVAKVHPGSSGSSRREVSLNNEKLVLADYFESVKAQEPEPDLRARKKWFVRKIRASKRDWNWLAEVIAIVSLTICLGSVVAVMLLMCSGC